MANEAQTVRDWAQKPANRENARVWAAALRSGEYLQGRGQLCHQRLDGVCTWCCLGVGADVLYEGDWQHDAGLWGIGSSYGVLDETIRAQLHLTFEVTGALIYLNDTAKWGFVEIADLLDPP